MSLFQLGEFTLASGQTSTFKIDCDALTADDWAALAHLAADRLPPFSQVMGVPTGGHPFALALRRYATTSPRLLIAEDVVTTGGSMERYVAELREMGKVCHVPADAADIIGVCAFARGPVPAWVTPLFTLVDPRRSLTP